MKPYDWQREQEIDREMAAWRRERWLAKYFYENPVVHIALIIAIAWFVIRAG